MILATKSNKEKIVHILSESFDTNKSSNWVIKNDHKRKKRLNALMSYAFDVCFNINGAYISEDKKAAVLFDLPNAKNKDNFLLTYFDIQLAFRAVGLSRVLQVMKRETYIKKKHPKTDFIYLWFIGILPEYQKKGQGSKMLEELIELSENNKMPIYLETSMPENLPFYKKYSFEIYHEWQSEDAGFTVWFMKRETNPGSKVPVHKVI